MARIIYPSDSGVKTYWLLFGATRCVQVAAFVDVYISPADVDKTNTPFTDTRLFTPPVGVTVNDAVFQVVESAPVDGVTDEYLTVSVELGEAELVEKAQATISFVIAIFDRYPLVGDEYVPIVFNVQELVGEFATDNT